MNNSQFRRLLIETPRQQDDGKSKPATAETPQAALGARKHSSIPMTPRQVGRGSSVQADFARQLAERNAKANPQTKARSSAPKGTKLAAGYTDRTKERKDEEDNEIAKRIKNLDESMKLGEIDRETFEKLVQEITGGHVETTHLVKGLDRKLLERVRRGEDVMGGVEQKAEEDRGEEAPEVEDAFDELAEEHVGPIVREKAEKKGEKIITPPPPPPPPAVAGIKRSRNDILKDLKRQREEAAKAAAAEHEKKYPTLGPGFRKVNAKGETTRIETDDKGREVLIVAGPDGKEKRKIKKQKIEDHHLTSEVRHDLDDATKPINMHNLTQPRKEESEDDDIFEGVGSNYNPLANLDNEDDDSEAEDTQVEVQEAKNGVRNMSPSEGTASLEPGKMTANETAAAPRKRDYFRSTNRDPTPDNISDFSSADATVRAALAKVRNLDENSTLLQNLSSTDPNDPNSKEARLMKRAAELAASDRDMEDMDLGFGASRFDDAEEMEREGEKVKFSQWKGLGVEGDEDEADEGAKGMKKRKRGSKKKRGDKNNPDDVLKVMERQKERKPLG
ncbi:Nn.00g110750.m01.CDS01 [Neocucurbitaria sp. VM-36]